jgi:predicted TPR repeat methyltransferase
MTTTNSNRVDLPAVSSSADFKVFLPQLNSDLLLDQDEEWCEVLVDGRRDRIRFHDYHRIYDIPGMYERLFYDMLECVSPRLVRDLLATALAEHAMKAENLRVLDVGAGNGMVGEEIRTLGVETVHGVDILEEAAAATRRDRPDVYDDYLVADLTDLTPEQHDVLVHAEPNTMTTVAALGFGDIPPAAFVGAFNLIETPGLLAFTIKDDFLRDDDPSGFSRLIQHMLAEKTIVPLAEKHYRHRLSVHGKPLEYIAFVARKTDDVPAGWIR